MLQGMLPYEQGAMIGRQFPERFGAMYPETPSDEPPMPRSTITRHKPAMAVGCSLATSYRTCLITFSW